MSWPKVAVIFIFVAGAVVAASLGQKDLGLCLAAAAAGFVHLGNDRSTVVRLQSDEEKAS
jgi:hypothetical protein